jgi:hypothetical protein
MTISFRISDGFLKPLQQKELLLKILTPKIKPTMRKTFKNDCMRKNPSPQRRGSKPRPTSTHTKATWAFDVSLANQIPPFIKSYQAPITSIPYKLHFNYSVIKSEIDFSPTTTTNHSYMKKIIINDFNFNN